MNTIEKLLTVILLLFLSFALIVELANLIGFGSQEIFLQHPDYPEGQEYRNALTIGRVKLIIWTLLTAGLLLVATVSKINKNKALFNWVTLITFTLAICLPFLAIISGNIAVGLIATVAILGLIGLTVFKMKKEKNTAPNIMQPPAGES